MYKTTLILYIKLKWRTNIYDYKINSISKVSIKKKKNVYMTEGRYGYVKLYIYIDVLL